VVGLATQVRVRSYVGFCPKKDVALLQISWWAKPDGKKEIEPCSFETGDLAV
jgi:hypothetical protein